MSKRLMKPLSIGHDKDQVSPDDIRWPMYASTKLDGIRGCVQDGVVLSNSGKPLASSYIQRNFCVGTELFDGEFGYGDPTAPDFYNKTQSVVNSQVLPDWADPKELRFYAFDLKSTNLIASSRLACLETAVRSLNNPQIVFLPQTLIGSFEEATSLYNAYLEAGFEGIILKRPGATYKEGRAAKGDQVMLRIKPFGNEFFEAKIIGYKCAFANDNDSYIDEQGYTRRSSHKDNKVPLDMLGSFTVVDCKTGIEFDLPASAMTHKERIELWKTVDDMLGRIVRYTCLSYGTKTKPRMPSFRGFRSTTDFSPTGDF